jgi:hypothetical protein
VLPSDRVNSHFSNLALQSRPWHHTIHLHSNAVQPASPGIACDVLSSRHCKPRRRDRISILHQHGRRQQQWTCNSARVYIRSKTATNPIWSLSTSGHRDAFMYSRRLAGPQTSTGFPAISKHSVVVSTGIPRAYLGNSQTITRRGLESTNGASTGSCAASRLSKVSI